MRIQAVIFDSDGTLVDSETLSAQVIVDILAGAGTRLPYETVLERFRGNRFARFADELLGEFPVMDADAFTHAFRARSSAVYATRLRPMDGALDLVQALAIDKCVASNGPREKIELCLGVTGLLPHFTGRIASAYEVGSWKPDPGLILHAASLMATPPGACLLVEDSHAGIEAGLAAGVQVVGFRLPPRVRQALSRPVPVIDNLLDIRGLIEPAPSPAARG
jgi:HAD superfamily hydrolase (TIGR01509 family)